MKGRYQVRLLFKEEERLSDNFALCKSRLASLLKRLSLKPEISKHYVGVIRQQLEQGIIEPADQGSNCGVKGSLRSPPRSDPC